MCFGFSTNEPIIAAITTRWMLVELRPIVVIASPFPILVHDDEMCMPLRGVFPQQWLRQLGVLIW